MPTLEEVLRRVPLPLMIDFTIDDVVAGAVSVTRAAGALDRALFVSDNVEALQHPRSLAPEARIGLTTNRHQPDLAARLDELGAGWWNPRAHLVTPGRVARVHDLGLQVSTWTVDRRWQMAWVVRAGVDAVVSNRIGGLHRHLG